MANTTSAKKAARKALVRMEINKTRRTRAKTDVRGVEEAIASGDKELALAALAKAEPTLARVAQKGVMHPRTASRKTSRLTARVNAMGA